MKTDLLSPPLSVVHTSMGTMAMMEMDVIQPMPANNRTSSGTRGEAYLRSLHRRPKLKGGFYITLQALELPTQHLCRCRAGDLPAPTGLAISAGKELYRKCTTKKIIKGVHVTFFHRARALTQASQLPGRRPSTVCRRPTCCRYRAPKKIGSYANHLHTRGLSSAICSPRLSHPLDGPVSILTIIALLLHQILRGISQTTHRR